MYNLEELVPNDMQFVQCIREVDISSNPAVQMYPEKDCRKTWVYHKNILPPLWGVVKGQLHLEGREWPEWDIGEMYGSLEW